MSFNTQTIPDEAALGTELDPKAQLTTQLQTWLIEWLTTTFGLDIAAINPTKSLTDYGLDSVTAISLVSEMEGWVGLRLPPTLVWDCPTIQAVAQDLAERFFWANS